MEKELKDSALKTGTTILGIVCKDGIVIAADRRGSAGSIVLAKNEKKVFNINDRFVVTGAGSGAAIQKMPRLLSAELKIKSLRSKSKPNTKQAANILANISSSSAAAGFLIGGVDEDGTTELYSLDPVGHILKVEDFDANFGSGMPFAYGLLERQYKENMTIKEGVELAKEAIKSATEREAATGNGYDIYSITKSGLKKEAEEKTISEYKKR